MNETIHDRIAELVQMYGDGKNTFFAEKIGVSEGNIRGYIKGVMPKQDVLEKIVRCFDINPDWLLTGRGDKRKDITLEKVNELATVLPVESEISKELIGMIREKDILIREQAEEIGRLREQIEHLERRREKAALDAQTSGAAHAG